ncbi:thiol reductant ABC exporter subunit CydC [Salisediminibacterium beveridgei]|nr:thiol reductant ABC exporter subunit CydC [Salisediminibacterium beveridgei]
MRDAKPILKLMLLEKKGVMLAALLGFLAAGASVGLLASSGYLISSAALQPPLYTLTATIVLVRFFGLLRAGSRYGERYFSHQSTFTILSHIRTHYFDRVVANIPGMFRTYRSGDLLSRITGDVENLQFFFLRVVYPPVVMLLVFMATIVFASLYSMTAAFLLFVGFLLTGGVIPAWFALKNRHSSANVRLKRGELATEVTEWMSGFRELKMHGQASGKAKDVHHVSKRYATEQEREQQELRGSESVNVLAGLMITWLLTFFVSLEVQNGDLHGVWLAALILISLSVFESANPMASFPKNAETSRQSAERLNLAQSEETPGVIEAESVSVNEIDALQCARCDFTYPSSERKSLEQVSLELNSGTRTAIVGASGSGKTTLMHLLLGIYMPQSGHVLVNGTPLDKVNLEDYWANCRFSLQENHFYYGSVRENLQLANPTVDDQTMLDALSAMALQNLTLDDIVEEEAKNLSGGERQRLALTRAWLQEAPFWVLDEPLSALDMTTYDQVMHKVLAKSRQDIFLLITHQLRGLEKMDQIIVMDKGRIVEQGSYTDLVSAEGWFRELLTIEDELLETS